MHVACEALVPHHLKPLVQQGLPDILHNHAVADRAWLQCVASSCCSPLCCVARLQLRSVRAACLWGGLSLCMGWRGWPCIAQQGSGGCPCLAVRRQGLSVPRAACRRVAARLPWHRLRLADAAHASMSLGPRLPRLTAGYQRRAPRQ